MFQSMTGYGRAQRTVGLRTVHIEVRALNSKNLDLSLRLPSTLRALEAEVRAATAQRAVRGKVDVNIWWEEALSAALPHANPEVAKHYVQQYKLLAEALQMPEPSPEQLWPQLMRCADVMQNDAPATQEATEEEADAVREALQEALDEFIAFRTQEGVALQQTFESKLQRIEALQQELVPWEQGRVETIRQRLEERLAQLKGIDYDRGRLEQELIYYIEKLDISEERQRLTNHIAYFRATMQSAAPEGIGKKLGFIAQEMGREINTTGSKSNQAEMQNIVVMMKDELEQIKEQVLNTL